MTTPEQVHHFHQIALERLRFVCENSTDPQMIDHMAMDPDVFLNEQARRLVMRLEAGVTAMGAEKIIVEAKWPDGWWQAFRERWFPKFWLKRWPVRYREIDINRNVYQAVCPHTWLGRPEDHHAFIVAQESGRDEAMHLEMLVALAKWIHRQCAAVASDGASSSFMLESVIDKCGSEVERVLKSIGREL